MILSKRANRISPSITLSISDKAKQMKKSGAKVLNFSAGEPDFDTPEEIKEAARRALDEGFTKYTPAGGIIGLKDAVIKKYENELSLTYDRSEIMVSNGGKHALHNVFQALLNPGDQVIIPSPYWLSYPELVKLSAGVPVIVNTGIAKGFKMEIDELKRAITPRTRCLIINSPSNPTGAVYRAEEMKGIADVVEQNDILIISDDVYEKFVFDRHKFVNILSVAPQLKRKVVIINSVSKTYSMPGWRIGFALGPEEVIKAATKIQGQATSCAGSISQKAAAFALRSDQSVVERFRRSFEKRRNLMLEGLDRIEGIKVTKPMGAFYVFADVSHYYKKLDGITGSVAFCEYLLDRFYIACVPGMAFGDDNYIRFSFATDGDSIKQAMERLRSL